MAEEAVKATVATEGDEVVFTVKDVPKAEERKPSAEVDSPPIESPVKEPVAAEEAVVETKTLVDEAVDEKKADNHGEQILPDNEKKALDELKQLLQDAINRREFDFIIAPPPPHAAVDDEEAKSDAQQEEETEKERKEVVEKENEVVVEANEAAAEEDDGTKTVEAIEETVVSVVPRSPPQDKQQQNASPEHSAAAISPSTLEQHEGKTRAEESVGEETASPTDTSPVEQVSIWGVPLLKDERTDIILWKFLCARDFKVKEAFTMIKNTLKWRKEFDIDGLLEQDLCLGTELENATFMQGMTKHGHPVCYNVYGVFQDKKVYQKMFADQESREKFLKWRIQVLERSVRKLDFRPGGISTILQVNDLHNSPGPGKWELRQATRQALHLLQDNYPEFVAKQVFIDVPWWYMAVNKMISPFLTQRTKSKFVVAGPSKSAETLFNYISPEQVPVEYGGLSKEGGVFGAKDGVTQIIVKPASKETVEFAVTEACNLTWEVRVVGWEASYGAEFVPNAKDGYTVIIQKIKKVGPNEETIISNSFKTSEPGKVVLTFHNSSSKKKRLLYRLKSIPLSSSF